MELDTEPTSVVTVVTTTTMPTQKKLESDCQELKNIKYKSMLMKGTILKETKTSHNMESLDRFLEKEKQTNIGEPWCKLNKTLKNTKLRYYVGVYQTKNQLTDEETELLYAFLKDCVDRKKLHRVKDVLYDRDLGCIKDIPSLCYAKASKHFTLKNVEKRVTTLKPKKAAAHVTTIRKKAEATHIHQMPMQMQIEEDDDDSAEEEDEVVV